MTKEIAEKLGVELDALTQAFEGFQVMSTDDLNTLKSNLSKGGEDLKEQYQSEGRKVGREVLLKELKDKLGLEYEGRKNPENLVNAITEKFANATNEEYAEKLSSLGKEKSALLEEFESFKSEIKTKEDNRFVQDSLTKEFNAYNGKTTLGIDDLMTLYTAKNSVKYDGEGIKIYNGDNLVKDDVMNPVTVQDSVKSFVESGYLAEPSNKGGRGEGDNFDLNSKMTVDKYSANLVKEGYNVGSMEHNQKIVEAMQNGIVE